MQSVDTIQSRAVNTEGAGGKLHSPVFGRTPYSNRGRVADYHSGSSATIQGKVNESNTIHG